MVKTVDMVVTGGCQCGAVRYRADKMCLNSHICHCRMCQKAVGHIFAALVAAPKSHFTWTRGAPSTFLSSAQVERGFCGRCGTPLFYNSLDHDRINLTIGSLDDPAALPPRGQIGTESRVAWFDSLTTLEDGGETEAGEQLESAQAIARSNRQHPDHDTDVWPPEPTAPAPTA